MNRSLFALAATAIVTIETGFSAPPLHVPATAHSEAIAHLIDRADHALRAYVAACSKGDGEAIGRLVTNDALVEYTLKEPGAYLSVDAAVLSASAPGNSRQKGPEAASVADLWIFPTNDSSVVFVQYAIRSGRRPSAQAPVTRYLALIEMRGDRIFKMRNFTVDGSTLARSTSSVATRALTASCAGARR